MHREFSALSKRVIGCAIEVHKILGPGLLESTYRTCLSHELGNQNISHRIEHPVAVKYKDVLLECGYRIDMLVEDCVVIENKVVERILPIHAAQLLTYLKLSDNKLGFILNWHVRLMKNGIKRYVNAL